MSADLALKDHVGQGKRVKFSHYTQGDLWYVTDLGFTFPVPVSDAGNATFLAGDKAILFMRYIRQHMEMLQAAKEGTP